jgi:hypothetical protein
MHSQKNSEIRRDLTETRCTLATQRPVYNTRKASLDRARGKIDASWPTRRRWASSPCARSSPDKINRGARPLSWCSEPWKKPSRSLTRMEVASECGCAGGGEAVAIPSEPDRSPHCFVLPSTSICSRSSMSQPAGVTGVDARRVRILGEDDLHAPDLCRPAVETRTESWARSVLKRDSDRSATCWSSYAHVRN